MQYKKVKTAYADVHTVSIFITDEVKQMIKRIQVFTEETVGDAVVHLLHQLLWCHLCL